MTIVIRARVVSWMTGKPEGYFRWCPVHRGGHITSRRKARREVAIHHRKCKAVVRL